MQGMMPAHVEQAGTLTRLWRSLVAMLRQRCPRCHTGRVFRGTFAMNDPCPVCGLIFEREEGYFLGAMYVSYALSSALLILFYVAAYLLLPGWDNFLLALIALLVYVPFVPVVFRLSRVIWIHFDRAAWPTDRPTSRYERHLHDLRERNEDGPTTNGSTHS